MRKWALLNLFKRKEFSMEDEIKRAISVRILLSILILILAALIIGSLNFFSTLKQVEKNVHEQCSILSEFTVSQLLIDNASAVQLNLKNINRKNKLIHFKWIEKGTPEKPENKIIWKFPFSWVEYCPIKAKENQSFGFFEVSGSLSYSYEMLSTVLMRVALSCCFIFTIFLLLYPLGKRIPQQIFVEPILEVLTLLKRGWKNSIELDEHAMPVEIREIKYKLIQLLKEAESHSHEMAFAQIAAKVAHDIRSPLAALNMLLTKNIAVLPEEELIIMKSAIERINTIADNLLETRKDTNKVEVSEVVTKPELAAILLKNIVTEKQVQYQERDIQFEVNINEEASRIFIDVNASELTRALSNLLNNAVEAIDNQGKISLGLSVVDEWLVLIISDTGKGMYPEQLSEIIAKSISVGKKHGSGIGLSSAIETIQSSGGTFSIDSIYGKGTTITLRLPIVPPRFVCEIPDFIFIDDSKYLTDAWQAQASLNEKKLVVFNSIEDAERYIHLFPKATPIYIDSDLGVDIKGEDLAKIFYDKGFSSLYLCTGRDETEFPPMPWIKKIVGKEYPAFS
jgi:signal transduction histidine kinase